MSGRYTSNIHITDQRPPRLVEEAGLRAGLVATVKINAGNPRCWLVPAAGCD